MSGTGDAGEPSRDKPDGGTTRAGMLKSREVREGLQTSGEGLGVWVPGSTKYYFRSSIKAMSNASGHRIAMKFEL
jgi:hypothetical protein